MIHNQVYNITQWIEHHPGGEAILQVRSFVMNWKKNVFDMLSKRDLRDNLFMVDVPCTCRMLVETLLHFLKVTSRSGSSTSRRRSYWTLSFPFFFFFSNSCGFLRIFIFLLQDIYIYI